jgi:hypothetical protein
MLLSFNELKRYFTTKTGRRHQAPKCWSQHDGRNRIIVPFPLSYSAGSFFFLNNFLILSNSSILAPCFCMMMLCWITESVLFQAQ